MDIRLAICQSVSRDLIGPQRGPEEVIENRPSDQYLTGILYPLAAAKSDEEEEERQSEDDDRDSGDDSDGSPGESISMQTIGRPNSMGISFAVEGENPVLRVVGSAGRYRCRWQRGDEFVDAEGERSQERWFRHAIALDRELPVLEGLTPYEASEGLRWYVRAYRGGPNGWQVTVVLANELSPPPGRRPAEEGSFFQVAFRVSVAHGTLVPRRPRHSAGDEDANTNNLIYRDAKEWAVGHTCSASWEDAVEASWVEATWMPLQHVRSMDADGDPVFAEESRAATGSDTGAFDAGLLANEKSPERLQQWLEVVPRAYDKWLDNADQEVSQAASSGRLSQSNASQARKHIEGARIVAQRMLDGAGIVGENSGVRRAFQLAQDAMVRQRQWTKADPSVGLRWRPFQLGFQLLALNGLSLSSGEGGKKASGDRLMMDLLWFPTGGGKTEAYLALTAFTLFIRRLRNVTPDAGAGVGVLMRYTLRLLTIQQFERASRLVLACELIRRHTVASGDASLGRTPFSIGLWVGSGATPNKVREARGKAEEAAKARQLARCPACGEKSLQWDAAPKSPRYTVQCTTTTCPFGGSELPVATIDEEVYRIRPSLLIGTADKFAQIVRNEQTATFFPIDGQPPDLIIQDELHLISGPLGTLAGLYESAIDLLCTNSGVPPKIIGSTATIRRASNQVRALFNRKVTQFPPPILEASNSGFAVEDSRVPGRIYVGLTSAGRSPKFLLQAVCASLLQVAEELQIGDTERDPFWTLVAYFNSLRELGGALVMMHDDVHDSMKLYAGLHGATKRDVPDEVRELTSRVASKDIPGILDLLAKPYPNQDTAVVLATNMLSVGIDIPRLGLMVVNGQPKGMSEYIQATSRVGRNDVPGLIFTCYNAGRPRDRSHYEAFRTWHQTLYRDVEATSVTPFAPRARDRALHAPVVALIRHRVASMTASTDLANADKQRVEGLIDQLVTRIRSVTSQEDAEDALREIRQFLNNWEARTDLTAYWDDWHDDTSLLISAERAATIRAVRGAFTGKARPTPNSLRDVEPSVTVRMSD